MKSMLPPDINPVSIKLGILALEPFLDSAIPASEEANPWAGKPKGNPGKPLESPAIKEAGKFANIEDIPDPSPGSRPRPESREAVPLAE